MFVIAVTAALWPVTNMAGLDSAESANTVSTQDFDPDTYLAKTAHAPSPGQLKTLGSILQDPNYLNANDATKRAIFERWAPKDPIYAAVD